MDSLIFIARAGYRCNKFHLRSQMLPVRHLEIVFQEVEIFLLFTRSWKDTPQCLVKAHCPVGTFLHSRGARRYADTPRHR